ncbi:MAG: HAD-IIIA family hydrolase [Brumimicrobium sp.]|nr:HAD-IIIA family hydrolase [Brumimicrobium sp.]
MDVFDAWRKNKPTTLFLDRDGVINRRKFGSYVMTPEEFIFLDGVKPALQMLRPLFDRIIIVTNQQGIAKGLMTKSNLEAVHRYMLDELEKIGVKMDAVLAAENLKGEKPDRRKPQPAMALEAKEMYPDIDLSRSIMVGDTDSDVQFGINVGMKTVLIRSAEETKVTPDLTEDSLLAFAEKYQKLVR